MHQGGVEAWPGACKPAYALRRLATDGSGALCRHFCSASTTRSMTCRQLPGSSWRNKRIVGYQGVSSRFSIQRQSASAGINVQVGRSLISRSARGWIHKAGNDGFIKVIEDAERSVLVGATSVGPYGGEVLSALQVAVRAEVPLATLCNMPYAYPTFYRAIEDALKKLNGVGSS